MNTLNTVKRREPAVGIGAGVTTILYAVYGILRASGYDVTDDMARSVEALVLALCAIPAVSGFLTRFFVSSPYTVGGGVNGGAPDGAPHGNVQPANKGGAV